MSLYKSFLKTHLKVQTHMYLQTLTHSSQDRKCENENVLGEQKSDSLAVDECTSTPWVRNSIGNLENLGNY